MKAILFDLDGTLLDTLQDLAISTNHALTEMGYPERTLPEIRRFLGNGVRYLMEHALPDGQGAHTDEAVERFAAYYKTHSEVHTRPYPGVPALLDRLKAEGCGLAVISNKPDFAVQILAKKYFPAVPFSVGERAGIARKPAPDAVLEALRVLGAEKENAVYVGDSEVDVQTAKNAGLPAILMTWGFRDRADLIAAGAETLADDADQLYTCIQNALV